MDTERERIASGSGMSLRSTAQAEAVELPESPPEEAQSGVSGGVEPPPLDPRVQAMIQAARHHGVELDPKEFRSPASEGAPSAASLSLWAQNSGMWSRAVRMRWRHLLRFQETGPVVLL